MLHAEIFPGGFMFSCTADCTGEAKGLPEFMPRAYPSVPASRPTTVLHSASLGGRGAVINPVKNYLYNI